MNSTVKPTTRRRSMRVATALTGMTCIVGATGVVAATPAYAGANGQQVQACGMRVSYNVSVQGNNQHGVHVTWGFHHVTAANGCITTTGWWWKGTVNIYAISTNGIMAVSKNCNVPTNSPRNVYPCGNV